MGIMLLRILQYSAGTRYLSWLRRYATSRKVVGSIPDVIAFFFIYLISPAALGVYSAFNRNEYQKQENVSGE
jgi:hypothetical protein